MSVLNKKWLVKNTGNKKTIEKLFENRELQEEMENFHDPFLFKDMEKSIERIEKAIKNQELIAVFGDYDVDGISGTAIIVNILKNLGANFIYRLPSRIYDGYGLSEKFINEFIVKSVKLIITVDCGISSKHEIKKAKNAGIDTIITDHHAIPVKIPEAFAILHPKQKNSKYPFTELTGSGVALKLAHGLIKKYFPEDKQEECLNALLDLASLGTVADLGQLKNENRLIVKKGLEMLSNTRWAGLKRIKELSNIAPGEKMNTTHVGFQIAPRINAAGRIGNPDTALALLLGDEQTETKNLGDELEKLNTERQEMTAKALEEANEYMKKHKEPPDIIIEHDPNWHMGIVGLIAGRIVEKYGRPSIIMQDLGDRLVASARSPEFFNIIEAIRNCSEYLENFGGHEQAAGFDLKKENLEKFKEAITKYAHEKLKDLDLRQVITIDCEIMKEEIAFDLFGEIDKLEPFGIGNTKPIFILKNIEPFFVKQVGKTGNHLKFSISSQNKYIQVIAFQMGEFEKTLKQSKAIDLVFHMELNRWNDHENIELQALDFNPIQR